MGIGYGPAHGGAVENGVVAIGNRFHMNVVSGDNAFARVVAGIFAERPLTT